MKVSITNNIQSYMKVFDDKAKRQFPFAIAQTLNDVAATYAEEMKRVQKSGFDKVTPFIRDSYAGSKRAGGFLGYRDRFADYRKGKFVATVTPGVGKSGQTLVGGTVANRVQSLQRFQIQGGRRKPLKKATSIPSNNLRLNQYGNIPNKRIQKLLARPDVFVGGPRSPQAKHLRAGIYERQPDNQLKALVWFEEATNYKKKLPAYFTAKRVANQNAMRLFRARLSAALRTAR